MLYASIHNAHKSTQLVTIGQIFEAVVIHLRLLYPRTHFLLQRLLKELLKRLLYGFVLELLQLLQLVSQPIQQVLAVNGVILVPGVFGIDVLH